MKSTQAALQNHNAQMAAQLNPNLEEGSGYHIFEKLLIYSGLRPYHLNQLYKENSVSYPCYLTHIQDQLCHTYFE